MAGKARKAYRHPANPIKAHADAERARSHAAGVHAQGTPRERSRQDARRAAIRREIDATRRESF